VVASDAGEYEGATPPGDLPLHVNDGFGASPADHRSHGLRQLLVQKREFHTEALPGSARLCRKAILHSPCDAIRPFASAAERGDRRTACRAAARAEHDKERVVLVRDGEPVAAVVPVEDLEALGAEDEYWSRAADGVISEWEAPGRPAGIPIEDIARDLDID
jgi:hypothetical protein